MSFRHTINLGNSIIGVSLLAMPYCFKQCGILLSMLLVLASGLINRAGCHLILRSARISRRRNFEHLAFSVYGSCGKTAVELGILGFLLGTCVAFFVVIGDLGPSLVAQLLHIPNSPHLRAFIMTFLGMFVVLPLGLLRRVESLSSFSVISMSLYAFLILKLFSEASLNFIKVQDLLNTLNWWNPSNLLTTLPIFVMSLSCQPQLFEIFDQSLLFSEDYSALTQLNQVIKRAVNICSFVYIMVGFLGYLAFYDQPFHGNVILALPSNVGTMFAKAGFIFTIIISLPLCLFPCRTSLHSMLFRKGSYSLLTENSTGATYMSDGHFRFLTLILITTTIGISILIPQIEFILGLIGSTIGAFVCFILPGLFFVHLTRVNNSERLLAKCVCCIGFFVLITCTYSTLNIETDADAQFQVKPLAKLKELNLSDISPPLDPLKMEEQKMNQLTNLDTLQVDKTEKPVKDAKKELKDVKQTTLNGNTTKEALQKNSNDMKNQSISKSLNVNKENTSLDDDANAFNGKLAAKNVFSAGLAKPSIMKQALKGNSDKRINKAKLDNSELDNSKIKNQKAEEMKIDSAIKPQIKPNLSNALRIASGVLKPEVGKQELGQGHEKPGTLNSEKSRSPPSPKLKAAAHFL